MKKVLIGLGVILLMSMVLCCGVTLWGGYRLKQFGDSYAIALEDLQTLNDKYPYIPSEDNEFSEVRLEQFFAIRETLATKVGENRVISALENTAPGEAPDIGFGEMLSMMTSFPREMIIAFNEALDANQMSPREYIALIQGVYIAIDGGFLEGDSELTTLHDDLKAYVDNVRGVLVQNQNEELAVDFDATLNRLSGESGDVGTALMDKVKAHKGQFEQFPILSYMELWLIENSEGFTGQGNLPQPLPAEIEMEAEGETELAPTQ